VCTKYLTILLQVTIKNATEVFFEIAYIVTCKSSYCFHRVLAITILSIRLSVHLSVTRVDQSKAVQARITKFSPSAARNYHYAIQIENLVFVY